MSNSSTWPIDRCYYSRSEWIWEPWQWRGTPHSPNLQSWSLTIKLFNVISRTPIGKGSYPSAEIQSLYSTAPADWAGFEEKIMKAVCYSYKIPTLTLFICSHLRYISMSYSSHLLSWAKYKTRSMEPSVKIKLTNNDMLV